MSDTRFQPGQSGNPAGRPSGARNRATLAREAALQERALAHAERMASAAEQAAEAVVERAQAGSIPAARLLIQTLLARRVLPVDLPESEGMAGVQAAGSALIKAVLAGEISPADAVSLQRLLLNQARLLKIVAPAAGAPRILPRPEIPLRAEKQENTGCPTPTRFLPMAEWLEVTGMGAKLAAARRAPDSGGLPQAA